MNDLGCEKIEWVSKHMPILNNISQDAIKNKVLKGYKIGVCLHIEAKTGYLVKKLIDAGATVAVCASNPLSTKDDIVSELKDLGAYVYARKGDSEEAYKNCLQSVADFSPDLYIDDGADLTTVINSNKEISNHVIGGTEETTTGIIRLKKIKKLEVPVMAVNDTPMKCMFDNRFGTAQSTIAAFLSTTNMSISGKKVVICGYGWCGKGLASRLKGFGAVVVICEIDPVKANEAILDGFMVMKMNDACKVGDIFITVTGCCDVINMGHIKKMKNQVVLMNSGHFDNEIRVDELKENSIKNRKVKDNIEIYTLESGKEIYLLTEGRLVNLVAGEGHPIEIIDLSFSLQFLALLYLLENKETILPGIIRVPDEIDECIAKANLQNNNVTIDKLSLKQKKYLGIGDKK